MQRLSQHTRLGLLLVVLLLAPLVVRAASLDETLSPTRLRELVAGTGALAPLTFVTVFVGAVVGQIPGLAFVAAAPALFRLPEAWALCFFASNLSVVVNFAIVRRFGGQPLSELKRPFIRRLFAHLDQHPIRTVALLRTVTVMFPPVTGALALTRVRARDHAIGSALGMLVPITAILLIAAALVDVAP